MRSKQENVDEHHQYRDQPLVSINSAANKDPPSIWFSKRFHEIVLLFLSYLINGVVVLVGLAALVNGKPNLCTYYVDNPSQNNLNSTINGASTMLIYILGDLILSRIFAASRVIGTCMLISGVILLNPFGAMTNLFVFLLFLILQYIFLMSFSKVLARWVLKTNKGIPFIIIENGVFAASVRMYPLCILLAKNWIWWMNSYATGVLCIVWSAIWLIVIRNEPLIDKRITDEECGYILQKAGSSLNEPVLDNSYFQPTLEIGV